MSQYHTPVASEGVRRPARRRPCGHLRGPHFRRGRPFAPHPRKLGPGGNSTPSIRTATRARTVPTTGGSTTSEQLPLSARGAAAAGGGAGGRHSGRSGRLSHHFDARGAGFSFRGEAPLDMRMNQRGALTAARVVNGYPADALTRLLGDWGELETPWKIANCIVRAREAAPIETTAQLVEAVKPCTPKRRVEVPDQSFSGAAHRGQRRNGGAQNGAGAESQGTASRRAAGRHLLPLARRPAGQRTSCAAGFLRLGGERLFGRALTPFELITRKAVVPSAEVGTQPRSRSAKLRAAAKRENE